MNLWQIITGNSTLPIDAANSLWDHLNNQQAGGEGDTYLVGGTDVDVTVFRGDVDKGPVQVDVSVEAKKRDHGVQVSATDIDVQVDQIEVEL